MRIVKYLVLIFVLFPVVLIRAESEKTKNPQTAIKITDVFQYLKTKTNEDVAMPLFPANSVSNWSWQRYKLVRDNPTKLYKWANENLLVAQKLLSSSKVVEKRQGLLLARDTNTSIAVKLKDKWLYARVFDFFLLPHIAVADDKVWGNLSRQRIIEGACAAYEATQELEKQIEVLRWLIDLAQNDDEEDSQNTVDWARGQLAQALALQKKYSEAIVELKAIRSDEMSEIKNLIPVYEKKLQEEKIENQEEKKLEKNN